jgi:hypothetical protein
MIDIGSVFILAGSALTQLVISMCELNSVDRRERNSISKDPKFSESFDEWMFPSAP